MRHTNLCILIVAMLATSAQAQTTRNWIYEYGYQASPANYEIDQANKSIAIKSMWFPGGVYCSSPSAATYRFKFDARTEEYQGGQWVDIGPGDIDSITLHPSANNPCVIIQIAGNGHMYGARHVKEIDLPTYLTARSELWGVDISGDLGTTYISALDVIGMIDVGGDLNAGLHAFDVIEGTITINGTLSAGGQIYSEGSLGPVHIAGAGPHGGWIRSDLTLTSSITVDGPMTRGAWIRVQNGHLNADITINGDMGGYIKIGGDLTGDITINGDMEADSGYDGWTYLWVAGDITTTSDVEINGNMGGFVRVDGDLEGSIDVDGDLIRNTWYQDHTFIVYGDLSGSVEIGGDCLGDVDLLELSGSLYFGGDVNRSVDITGTAGPMTGLVRIGGDITGAVGRVRGAAGLSGRVLIDGRLAKSGQNIRFADPVTSTGAIAIDYDGWHSTDDDWETGAYITVDGANYYENASDYRIYKTTQCKGDMGNSGSVDFDDVDPFVAALSDPDPDDFEAAYPGRGGSMLYHGDMDCDNDIDFDDVDPFVARLGQACVGCPERDGGGGGRLSPLELAHELAIHIAPQRYDDLCDIIAAVAQRQRDAERAAYWTAVWEYLSQ